jgi:hypothetical protein
VSGRRRVISGDDPVQGGFHAPDATRTGLSVLLGLRRQLYDWQLDYNPATVQIAAVGSYLIQRHRDGSVWLYTPNLGPLGSNWIITDINTATVGIVVARAPPLLLQNDEPLVLYQTVIEHAVAGYLAAP